MAKKIVAVFRVSPTVLALREFEAGLRQHPPKAPGWGELAASARRLLREDELLNRGLLRAASGLRGQRGFSLRPVPSDDPATLRGFDLAIDLPTLLTRRNARGTLQLFLALLGVLLPERTWQAEIRIGKAPRTTSLRDLARELLARAAEADLDLPAPDWVRRPSARTAARPSPAPSRPAEAPAPAAPPHETLKAGPARARRQTPAPPAVGAPEAARTSPGATRATSSASGAPPAAAGAAPPRGRKKKPRAAAGSFGGLPDDEVGAPPAASPETSQEAEFFLSYGRLTWPCTEAELRTVHRQIVKTLHPDRHPGDAAATHRFMLLQRGYEALRARLAG